MSILIKLKKITDLILLPKTLLKSLYKKLGIKQLRTSSTCCIQNMIAI